MLAFVGSGRHRLPIASNVPFPKQHGLLIQPNLSAPRLGAEIRPVTGRVRAQIGKIRRLGDDRAVRRLTEPLAAARCSP